LGKRLRLVVGAVVVLVLLAGGAAYVLTNLHHAPPAFALSTPSPQPSGSLVGKWKVTDGSEVGYRVKEQFINQSGPTEAVARTTKVTGGIQVRASGASYVASSIDFAADLSTLVSQDKYATFQAFQRDFFVRTIYLQTNLYPNAEFKADSAQVAIGQAPGPVTIDVPGQLTAHGETHQVTTHLTVQVNGDRIEMAGSISIDMRDFNVSVPDISFTKAQPVVLIEYHLLLVRA
jgi:polyisoprenoid-binding protein YceI